MSGRINDKIEEIEEYLNELSEYAPATLEDYLGNQRTQRACERLFEIIMEAIIDLVFIFINEKEMDMPEDDESALSTLIKKEIISTELGKKLREARRMRNIVAHKYGSVNPSLVYEAVSGNLNKDVMEFLEVIRRKL